MKEYEGKTLQDVLEKASEDLNVPVEKLQYQIIEEKKGLIIKKCIISVLETSDLTEGAIKDGEEFLKNLLKQMGIEIEVQSSSTPEGLIKMSISVDPENKKRFVPLIIGKKGKTLGSINNILKLFLSNKYKRKVKVLLDVQGYKMTKYNKIITQANKLADEVERSHADITMDSMSADERRQIHNSLASRPNIKTESIGEEPNRCIVIHYIGEK